MTHPLGSRRGAAPLLSLVAAATLGLSACGGDTGSGSGGGGEDAPVAVSLITKTQTNPFFVAMQEGAQEEADELGVDLTTAAGREDGDEATQVQAIENAISSGQQGILITPNGPGVNSALERAREAGLYVMALDTPPDPPETVDLTIATDNREAGRVIGEWAKSQLGGQKATIALLDLFNDKVVSVDYNRDQGFLEGMGIDVADPQANGDEAATGSYDGGEYEIVCNEPTTGAEDGGRTAMENCLSRNPEINVVYTINEPAAAGAYAALQAAGREQEAIIVSVDGGCAGVQQVAEGTIGATAQQYPVEMARQGVSAVAEYVRNGTEPQVSEGLDFLNTGVALVTDTPAEGLESITTDEASEICWG
ncbi:substrate-binding domain-containing protein [Quadrisphaera sp. DSM 44207]|uniref:substrate-binding domain-containing protein n=1 Tax=Quadrisphaera sp. DSM 44207 TaxID=1881057 RepID=UPI0008905F1D|nr:substrate-binding domain-containing protein [Quadrisphaera sp. DSM 44207]SDQ64041.1 fructose transport system substrate-binding protein [Quadrisphaera sp. DSM 44207]